MPQAGKTKKFILISDLDRLIHSPARLVIVRLLYKNNTLDFAQLMKVTKLTWGNLSTHLSKLEEAKYVSVTKTFTDKRPYTLISLTESGRSAFISWCDAIVKLIPSFVMLSQLHGMQSNGDDPGLRSFPADSLREEQITEGSLLVEHPDQEAELPPIQDFIKL